MPPTQGAIARNGSEVIPVVPDEGVSDVIKSGERASPFTKDIEEDSRLFADKLDPKSQI